MFLICESSCSAAVLQSGTRCVGVGLGAGVGGDAGAEGRSECGTLVDSGLVGVMMGRGADERDIRLCLRVWEEDDEKRTDRSWVDGEAKAPMSVSESVEGSGALWSAGRSPRVVAK